MILGTGLWGTGMLYFAGPGGSTLRPVLALAMAFAALLTIVALCFRGWRWSAVSSFVLVLALLGGWWSTIRPSNDRDWQPEVARLAEATIQGDLVTIRNIRNFDYRTETDFTPRWYDATFDLADLRSADLVAVYWMGDAIAHVMVSFGFTGDRYLAVSIETRKERGESYSTLAGFF